MNNVVLAIEAAILGGSVAVLRNGELAAEWASATTESRAEELLIRVDEVLARSGNGKDEIARVAVSIGPGSFTGVRVGIATAMGLARGFGVPCVGVLALPAMLRWNGSRSGRIALLPTGRGRFAALAAKVEGKPVVGGPDAIKEFLKRSGPFELIVPHGLAADLGEILVEAADANVSEIMTSLASLIGAASGERDDGLIPYYAGAAGISATGTPS